jgi:hypothetical protein
MGIGRPTPVAIDDRGNWYAILIRFGSQRASPGGTYPTALARLRPHASGGDSLATIREAKFVEAGMSNGVITNRSVGFEPTDVWGVFGDGRVLVVRSDTYTPEIVDPNGATRVAAPVSFTPVPVTASDRERNLDSLRRMYAAARFVSRDGDQRRPQVSVNGPNVWQEHHPPVIGDAILIDTRQRAWVHVMDGRRAEGERYDLLDREGRRVDAIRLPKGTRLVAMGRDAWYGTREDEDGLVYLQRFPLP